MISWLALVHNLFQSCFLVTPEIWLDPLGINWLLWEKKNLRETLEQLVSFPEEKVQMATSFHELVERYLRRLDVECHKFKMELEADNRGITEILEKRKCHCRQLLGCRDG